MAAPPAAAPTELAVHGVGPPFLRLAYGRMQAGPGGRARGRERSRESRPRAVLGSAVEDGLRRREPGFYVSVQTAESQAPLLGAELLDGPWASREAAEARRREILARHGDRATSVVRVAEDGVTILRDDEA